MISFNVLCKIKALNGHDLYAKRQYVDRQSERVAVVKLGTTRQHSTVRADSSATNAFAEEFVADAKLLFKPTTVVKVDDVVEVAGVLLRVKSKFPRIDVWGKLDHYEVKADIE